jgi:hypothetical protein
MLFCKTVLMNEILICTVAFLLNLLFQVLLLLRQVVWKMVLDTCIQNACIKKRKAKCVSGIVWRVVELSI